MKRSAILLTAAALLLSVMAFSCAAAPKTLVVYFSVFGHTETVAGYIADAIGADMYRIEAEKPYDPEVDLGQTARRDANSRVNIEDQNEGARPGVVGQVDNMAEYEVIFLGHPIWFGKAPKVVRTFLEKHDLSGKTIVTFCTSGSSEIGDSSTQLRSSFGDSAKLIVGRSFRNATRKDAVGWINSIGLGYNAK